MANGIARAFAALVAVTAWTGLAVQFAASFRLAGSAAAAIWAMLRYFTITTNVLGAVLFTGIALGWPGVGSPRPLAGVTLAMLLVGIVYGLLLRGLLELSGGAALADLLLHSVTPVLVPLFWLLFVRKGALRWVDPLLWAIYPLAYGVYALVRGGAEGFYAYPFIDVGRIGWGQTSVNAAVGALCFVAAGCAMVLLDHRLGGRSVMVEP